MDYVTYYLAGDLLDSYSYYKNIKNISKNFFNSILHESNFVLEDYMKYIQDKKIESLRSREEYTIELLFIGIIFNEYLGFSRGFNTNLKSVFMFLNNIRKKSSGKKKIFIDKLRGKLINKYLLIEKISNKEICFSDFCDLNIYLKCTGDFNEECMRLDLWKGYLKQKSAEEFESIINISLNIVDKLKITGDAYLKPYVKNVARFLKEYKEEHKNKEDIIYCGKSINQYYFNMICSEIMNKIYSKRFKNTDRKIVFVPACMREKQKECRSVKTERGYCCMSCSKRCNVNKLKMIGEKKNFKVLIIPHESDLFKLKQKKTDNIGIIGAACVLNLISGGFKALRLGFIPQCIILDYCGCSTHWQKEAVSTCVNENRIIEILS